MKIVALGALMSCVLASDAVAQVNPAAVPAVPASVAAVPIQAVAASPARLSVPANTEVLLSMNEDLSTKGGKIEVGTKFRLSLVQDVTLNGFVVIPRGTGAVGEVTWKTGKGMFGKSGKMEIDLRHLDLNGRIIPITGHYRQEGSGNTVATVATVVLLAPIAGMLVTGRSAVIPQGRELKAYLAEPLPVELPANAVPVSVVQAIAVPVPPVPVATKAAPAVTTAKPGDKL